MNYLLFDLDGTLTDPGEGITNSVAYAIEKMGDKAPSRELLYEYIGPPLVDMFQEKQGYSEECAYKALAYYREYFSEKGIFENKMYDKIPELLEKQKKAGNKIVLATSKPEPFAIKILEHFDIKKYFDFIAGSTLDETRTKKDEVISYALSSLGNPPRENVYMIGDRKHDIKGAKVTGVHGIGVLYGYGSYEELFSEGAEIIAEDITALEKILENL